MRLGPSVSLFAALVACSTLPGDASRFVVFNRTLPGWKPLDMAVLHDTATGQEAEIIFSSGGRINRLLMRSASGGLRDVLMRTTDADIVRTNANHFRAAVLAPWANRIGKGQYSWFGTQYQLPCNEDNSLRDDALHGFMLNRSFAVGGSAADDTHAEVTIVADVPRLSWPGWPWSFRLSIVFSFDARGLRVTTSMTNTEESASLPFFHSMHPYVNVSRTSDVLLRLGPCEMCGEPRDNCGDWRRLDMGPLAPRAGPLLPLGTTSPFTAFDGSAPVGGSAPNATYYDDEFTMTADAAHCGSAGVTLVDPSYPGDAVTVWGDSNFRVFQVFTGSFTWGEQSVAIEPMSGAANAYNTGDGLTVLAAGATHTDEMGIYFRASAR